MNNSPLLMCNTFVIYQCPLLLFSKQQVAQVLLFQVCKQAYCEFMTPLWSHQMYHKYLLSVIQSLPKAMGTASSDPIRLRNQARRYHSFCYSVLVKSTDLNPGCLIFESYPCIYQLCDLGKLFSLFVPLFPLKSQLNRLLTG